MTVGDAERMTAILKRVGGELLGATPEGWTEATLRVEVKRSGDNTAITHSIRSEQHPADVAVGTDELYAAPRELQLLADQAGEPWAAFEMREWQEDGDWKFDIHFEYDD